MSDLIAPVNSAPRNQLPIPGDYVQSAPLMSKADRSLFVSQKTDDFILKIRSRMTLGVEFMFVPKGIEGERRQFIASYDKSVVLTGPEDGSIEDFQRAILGLPGLTKDL